MTARESDLLPLLLGSFCIIFQLFLMRWVFWDYPLQHGRGFFLGVKVAPGSYKGPGAQWLRRYRALLLAAHAIMVVVFVALVASHRWNDMPIMAPVIVELFFAMFGGFTLWTRHRLGATPPKSSSVAISFETRHLSDYVSWRAQALLVALLAASWLLLFFQGDAEFEWAWPALITYAVIGLLPAQIIIVHRSYPLPSESTEEHQRWQEACRRYWLRVTELMRWFFVVRLAGYAVEHGLAAAKTMVWLHWLFFSIYIVVFSSMLVVLIQGSRRLVALGRDLYPIGSWSGPFGPARLLLPGWLTWSVVYVGGLLLLGFFLKL
jgi:hypothetical protein